MAAVPSFPIALIERTEHDATGSQSFDCIEIGPYFSFGGLSLPRQGTFASALLLTKDSLMNLWDVSHSYGRTGLQHFPNSSILMHIKKRH